MISITSTSFEGRQIKLMIAVSHAQLWQGLRLVLPGHSLVLITATLDSYNRE